MQIAQPYLLFLGDVTDPLAAKTARGIHQWRPEICLGQLRLTSETVSLGFNRHDAATSSAARRKNACHRYSKTLVV